VEELPIPAHVPGNLVESTVELGGDYGNQLFFDLRGRQVVSQNAKTDWDLGFEASAMGWRVRLNSARGGALAHTGVADWSLVSSITGLDWQYDASSGHPDSTAMGDYRAQSEVVVIDRGYDSQGNHTGYFKMQVLAVDSIQYTVRFALLNGGQAHTLSLPKQQDLLWLAYSFDQANRVEIAPPSSDWDLLFSQYTHVFHEPLLPYLVTGVLLNPSRVSVARLENVDFDAIDRSFSENLAFQTQEDAIGYDWKSYDFGTGQYEVDPALCFVIKDAEGRLFKLKFVDFYSDLGEKGAPTFLWQEL
jgi:hypothetical protein